MEELLVSLETNWPAVVFLSAVLLVKIYIVAAIIASFRPRKRVKYRHIKSAPGGKL